MIATKVDVLGTEYTIELKVLRDEDCDGFCDYTSKRIVIRSDNTNAVDDFEWLQKKQLRHEIVHAFLAESGLQCNFEHAQKFGHEETTVDWIAVQFPKLLHAFKEAGAL